MNSALDAFAAADAEENGSVVEAVVGEVVLYNPDLIRNTQSKISTESVKDEGIMLVDIKIDTSGSMVDDEAEDGVGPLVPLQLVGHDWYIQSLLPALEQGVTILVSCTGLNGHVYYPFTPLQDVPLFGRKPQPWDAETPNGATGLVYGEAVRTFITGMYGGTPLYDRMVESAVATLAEGRRWRQSGRIAQMVQLVVSDGLDRHSQRTLPQLQEFYDELGENGAFTALMMLMMDCPEEGQPGYTEALQNMRAHYAQMGIPLPPNGENMTPRELLDELFRGVIRPANLLAVGSDPRKVRHCLGIFSKVAEQKSRVAAGGADSDDNQ